jgi:UDPglucose 6-dehydrogenase
MRIAVIGTGYVGLVTGIALADSFGHHVVCVDMDADKIRRISRGETVIYEEGLEKALGRILWKGRFTATANLEEAVSETECAFICVGTPSRDDGSVDLSQVEGAAGQLKKAIGRRKYTIIIKSTVIPGTTSRIAEGFQRNVRLGMSPEFLREGTALHDFIHPDRLVFGADDGETMRVLRKIYEGIDAPKLEVGTKTAEMVKYASNAFLATKISFINEIGNVCKELGVDVYKVAEGMGLDHRISPHFLKAGAGFGGSCFPKDVKALLSFSKSLGHKPGLLKAVMEVNDMQPLRVVELLERRLGGLSEKEIAVLGLSFKPGTDDMRESRSIVAVDELLRRGARVRAYDPKAAYVPEGAVWFESAEKCLSGVDACVVMTAWEEFGKSKLYEKVPLVVDARNMLRLEGRNYEGLCW